MLVQRKEWVGKGVEERARVTIVGIGGKRHIKWVTGSVWREDLLYINISKANQKKNE